MLIHESEVLNEKIIIIENRDEYAEAIRKAEEIDSAIYTRREVDYLIETVADMNEKEKKHWLISVNQMKKRFGAFMCVPKDWKFKND